MSSIQILRMGLCRYADTWQAMRDYTERRDTETPDQLWLLQHQPVFTQGQAGRAEHLLEPGGIPVVQSDRGGQVTYHGPGQLVMYVLLDLQRRGIGVKALVRLLEQSVIELLAGYGIEATVREGAPGVYCGAAKIASLGLRVRRGRSYHGLSLNVDMDLEPFDRIDTCGYPGLAVTRLADLVGLGEPPDIERVGEQLAAIVVRRVIAKQSALISERSPSGTQ